ncbi:MAG: DNA replication/repair protein RecF [Pseudomonadota bacterium]
MSLCELRITDFRCIAHAKFDLDAPRCVVHGQNGSGKTSVLEAIYSLSRGRSFRGTRIDQLVRHEQKHYQLFAETESAGARHKIGLAAGRGYREIRVDGQTATGVASLAEQLAVQVIDPEVQALISEGPELRRQFLDYGVFHVEHDFLDAWRQYRRILKQRNGALRQARPWSEVEIWSKGFVAAAERVDELRRTYCDQLDSLFGDIGERLLDGHRLRCYYKGGWDDSTDFREALEAVQSRDQEQGTTTVGPHRADLVIEFSGRRARQQVSRGQQKLVASALVLAQTKDLQTRCSHSPVLLVDDPAAELDSKALERLLRELESLACQQIITALEPDRLDLPGETRLFHVEHGVVTQA